MIFIMCYYLVLKCIHLVSTLKSKELVLIQDFNNKDLRYEKWKELKV